MNPLITVIPLIITTVACPPTECLFEFVSPCNELLNTYIVLYFAQVIMRLTATKHQTASKSYTVLPNGLRHGKYISSTNLKTTTREYVFGRRHSIYQRVNYEQGWDQDYEYVLTIEYNNGIRTRYASMRESPRQGRVKQVRIIIAGVTRIEVNLDSGIYYSNSEIVPCDLLIERFIAEGIPRIHWDALTKESRHVQCTEYDSGGNVITPQLIFYLFIPCN